MLKKRLYSCLASICFLLIKAAPVAASETAPIAWSDLGAAAGREYNGDGLRILTTPDSARLRCVFQRLEGEATTEGLWISSTATNVARDRFRVVASGIGRQAARSADFSPLQLEEPGARSNNSDDSVSGASKQAEACAPLPRAGKVEVAEKLVRFLRPGLVEEYSVSMDGVRQDFVIEARPDGEDELRLDLTVDGARVEPAEFGARLVLAESGRKIAYSRLRVVDATGRELESRIEAVIPEERGVYAASTPADPGAREFSTAADPTTLKRTKVRAPGALVIVVNDTEAVYPIRIDPTFSDENWISMGGFPGANDVVNAAIVDAAGNLYIGGDFTVAGTATANKIAKWDGNSWSALGSGMDNTVKALAVSGSDLYVGGSFTTAGSVSASRIAKWDGSSWSALGSGVNGQVNALTVLGSDLYVGGQFTTAGNVSGRNRIAKWALGGTDDSSWSALGSGVGSTVNALAVSGSDLYVGGSFTMAGNVSGRNRIAKWALGGTDDSSWSALGLGVNGTVNALAVLGSDLYVGGLLTTADNGSASRIAKWNGSSWSALGSGISGSVVNALAVSGSDLYVGGLFSAAGGVSTGQIAKWNGSSWSALGSGVNGSVVNALAVSGSDLYVGGVFAVAGGVSGRVRIAKWALGGTSDASWATLGSGLGPDSQVNALAVSGNDLYVGGIFTSVGGNIQVNRVAKWDGVSWSALGSGLNGAVNALAVSGSDLYVGGSFTTAGGVSGRNRIAKWALGGTDDSSWSALGSGVGSASSDVVNVLLLSGSDLYVGGQFSTAGGISAIGIAKWGLSGTSESSWSALGSGVIGTTYALGVSGSDLYVGGSFSTAGGVSAKKIAKWALGGTDNSSWSALGSGMDGIVFALAVSGNNLYVGGQFTTAGGVPASQIAKWALGGTDDSSWSALGSGGNSAVLALQASGNDLYAGGNFTTAGGKAAAYVAKADITPDGPSVSSIDRQSPGSAITGATTVTFRVVFSEAVMGVDKNDFTLTANGASGVIASISAVDESTYDVTVDSISGDGTLRLDLNASGTGIQNDSSSSIIAGFTTGQTYTVDMTAPAVPGITGIDDASDLGDSNADNLTSDTTPTVIGQAESGATVTIYDGSAAVGSATASGGSFSVTTSALSPGNHTLTATAMDVAGNVSAVSPGLSITIDTTAPAVSEVTSSTSDESYKINQTIVIQMVFSEPVTVSGTPQLTLETGTADRIVDYASGSGTTTLTFNYVVQSGDANSDLDYASTSALGLNGGSIKDAAGNNAALTLPAPGQTGSLSANKALEVDTATPTVSSVDVPSAKTYFGGENLDFTVNFSEAVTVSGTPQLGLALDTGGSVVASYQSGSGTTAIVFRYTVASGVKDTTGVTVTGLSLNSGTIQDGAGNDAVLTLNSVASTTSVLVDGTNPRVTDVTSSTANGTYKIGDTISIQVTFSTAVNVTGTPQVSLETGTTDQMASYDSGTGSSTLVFNYVVQSGDSGADLDYTAADALVLNSGTIKDSNGVVAILTLPPPGASGSLGANKALIIDGVAPTVTAARISITGASGTSGAYKIGDTVTATWDNTSSGDNNNDVASVMVDFSAFGGGSAVTAINTSETWKATYTIVAGTVEASNQNVSVTVTDNAGNITTTTDDANVQVDNVAPAAPNGLDLVASSDSGIDTDNITGDNTPTINGTAPAGVAVELFRNGTISLGTTTAGTDGSWSITASTVPDGVHSLTAKAKDAVGNVSAASTALSITIDSGTPSISDVTDQTIDEDGATADLAFTVSDTMTAASDLVMDGDSSNTALVKKSSIVFSGSGGTRTVKVTPESNQNGQATITLTVKDQAGNTQHDTFVLTVNAVNDAPVLVAFGPALTSITEDQTSNGGQTVASIVGTSISDVDSGAVQGIAITNVVAGTSKWQYSVDSGANWADVGTVSPVSALLLKATDLVKYVPDGKNGTTASITYRAWDQTSGTTGTKVDASVGGNATAFSSDSDTATITVSSVNDAPVLANAILDQSGGYGGSFSYAVASNTFSDVDSGDTLAWSASGLPPGLSFNTTTRVISGTMTAAGVYPVTITGTDSGNTHADATFTFSVAKAVLTITAENKTMIYGDPVPELTATYAGFVNGDVIGSIPEAVSLSTTATSASSVETYPIFVSGGSSLNYTIQRVQGTLTINKVKLIVKADDKSRKYQSANPAFTSVVTGAKNGEVIQVTFSTSATVNSPVGTYPIVVGISSRQRGIGNYDVTLINGTLTIQDQADLAGLVHDGYVAGGTVFFDANNNHIQDAGEPSATTDDNGQFNISVKVSDFDKNKDGQLDASEGVLVVVGGVDIATGLPLQTSLTAPFGSTVLNPLTTLVSAALDQNPSLSVAEAESSVAAGLGLSGVSLTQYDAFGGAKNDDPGATAVLSAGAKVQDSLVQVTALLTAASGQDSSRVAQAVAQALSAAASSGSLDLSQPTAMQQVIEASAANTGATLKGQVAAKAAEVIAQGNQLIDQASAMTGSGAEIALEISRRQGVSQGDVAATLQEAAVAEAGDVQKIVDEAKQQQSQPSSVVGVLDGDDSRPGAFNFSQREYEIQDLSKESAPITIFRTGGSKGAGTVVLALSLATGQDALTIPLNFANREIRKTVDVLEMVRTNQLLLGVEEVAMHLLQSQSESTNQATLVLRSAPAWTAQPVDTDSMLGSRVEMHAIASGSPKPVYQWYKNGELLPGQTGYQLMLEAAGLSDAGQYYAVASNVVGVITSRSATLNVLAAPVVSLSATNQTVMAGAQVGITAQAQGTAPLSYQWKKNGVALAGQNSATLTLTQAQESDSGDYTVTVSNAYGSVTTGAAHLEVVKSALSIVSITRPAEGKIQIHMKGPSGTHARLEASADLKVWSSVSDVVFTESGFDYTDPNTRSFQARFYRIVQP